MKATVLIFCLACACAFAAPEPPAKANKVKASARHRRPSAGVLFRKGEGKPLLFVDYRGSVAHIVVSESRKIGEFTSIVTESSAEPAPEGCPAAAAHKLIADGRAGAVVAIVAGKADAPAMTVLPEDRVAIINATRLADADTKITETRLVKELWRATAFALGGYASDYPDVMKPVFGTADLDSNNMLMFCPPVSGKVAAAAKAAGVAPLRAVPYAIAVREGWAPAPTNDVQKAVWDRVKAAATNAPAAKVSHSGTVEPPGRSPAATR